MNLKNGRIVVLVVGDGIKSEAEDLAHGLQSHAGFHFTFALIELAVFNAVSDGELLVVPNILAKTCMIERGIVRIDDQRSEVIAQSITSEQFFDAMRKRDVDLPTKLKAFIDNLSPMGVYPEFRRSLNLKWDTPTGHTLNLGYIPKNGQLWTDATGWAGGDVQLFQSYIDDLAQHFGGEVTKRNTDVGYLSFYFGISNYPECHLIAISYLTFYMYRKLFYQF